MLSKKLKIRIKTLLLNNKNKIKINSKDISKGDVFVSLQGKNTHGNIYIEHAIKKGARFIITDKKINLPSNKKNILIVNDSLKFLLNVAKKKRKIFKGKVIGITGSVGKTSVKENLKFFLSNTVNISASIRSYNNFLGVLVSIINMDLKSVFAIFEIGTNNYKEIRNLASIVLPQQIIITNIFPTHLENFENTRNIAIEKSDIFNTKYNPCVKLLILPNSNKNELFLFQKGKKMKISNIITLGNKTNSNYVIKKIYKIRNNLSEITIKSKNEIFTFKVGTNIYHQIYNIIICLIIFKYNNLDLETFYRNSKIVPKVEGRGLAKNIIFNNKKIRFIDESYNASPETMKICIEYFYALKMEQNQKKFLILGNMNELGKNSKKYHKKIINKILDYNFENVILCGEFFKSVLNNTKIKNNNINYIPDEDGIIKFLRKKIHNNDTILIKGSNSTKVNNLANILNANME